MENNHNHWLKMKARPRMLYDTIILNIGTLLLSQETQKIHLFIGHFKQFQ